MHYRTALTRSSHSKIKKLANELGITNDLAGWKSDVDNGYCSFFYDQDNNEIVTSEYDGDYIPASEFLSAMQGGKVEIKEKVKTYKDVLEEVLPPIYFSLAYYNTLKFSSKRLKEEYYGDSKYAIGPAFIWDETPEGQDFWSQVDKALQNNTKLPKIPDPNNNIILKGIVPDYQIKINVEKEMISVGCQDIPADKMQVFVDAFVKAFPKK